MKRLGMIVLLAFAAVAAFASNETESKWTVSLGTKYVGKITVLSSSYGERAEWSAGAAPVIFLRVKGQTWVRQTGGDVELASYKGGIEKSIVPPVIAADPKSDKLLIVKVKVDGKEYSAKRTSVGPSNADASNFTVNSRKSASSKISRLSGDLFGSSSSGVSATAGGRGVGNSGMSLKDGGNYTAVADLEKRDEKWKNNLDEALKEFQKSGKVGKERD